jgi:hypothetical protein
VRFSPVFSVRGYMLHSSCPICSGFFLSLAYVWVRSSTSTSLVADDNKRGEMECDRYG